MSAACRRARVGEAIGGDLLEHAQQRRIELPGRGNQQRRQVGAEILVVGDHAQVARDPFGRRASDEAIPKIEAATIATASTRRHINAILSSLRKRRLCHSGHDAQSRPAGDSSRSVEIPCMIGGERAAGRRVHGRHQWPDLHLRLRRALAGGLGRHGRHRALQRGRRPAQADRDRDPWPDGDIKFIARAKVGGMELEWEDLPCNWVREHWFEHRRRFTKGPLALMDARLDLTPTQQAATATTAWKRRRAGCSGAQSSPAASCARPSACSWAWRSRPTGSRGASGRSRSCRRRCRLPGPPGRASRRWPSSWRPALTGMASPSAWWRWWPRGWRSMPSGSGPCRSPGAGACPSGT